MKLTYALSHIELTFTKKISMVAETEMFISSRNKIIIPNYALTTKFWMMADTYFYREKTAPGESR